MTNSLIYLAYAFITLGVILNLLASLALLRFPDVYTRLLSSTKCITFGTLSILFGVFIIHGFTAIGVKSLLCLIFILLTSPIETNVLLRAAKKSESKMTNNEKIEISLEDTNSK
jgi:multicomponent Na+:H+ antiporter subunit G